MNAPKAPGALVYLYRVFQLFAKREITWKTCLWAMRTRPPAVCGRRGSFGIE